MWMDVRLSWKLDLLQKIRINLDVFFFVSPLLLLALIGAFYLLTGCGIFERASHTDWKELVVIVRIVRP